jgi:hypothetical protein
MTNDFVANIFGMPPSKANRPPQDERQAINAIMGGLGFPSIYKPAEPAPMQRPATVDELPTPCAEDLAQTIADIRDVPLATAIRWLAERADEFKTLAESQK